mmetsp:Transcript_1423/g.3214  ORF Transcript_1423/g.3214 Transcript_1423/m.3214 type:complete len:407 (+) Transcript_1423:119-1339(+)|eukprot:CAMPEP_0171337390 /NCGR_PEP_ID=MMETSP0878-20121228/6660_1 /TAXON_ID=67004 /ORGANISM="Thalassiosira weissflogii, Strain CCMP1336" /LENGTH=406 /DNA_ID=CAMNT_0011839009 /DNA_START=48 /DNA_END=1268 /DNA_ORIENTATION=+
MPPLSIPPELKKIGVFIKRAEELDRDKSSPESRVVAFNCRQYAVLQGIPLVKNSAPAKSCLSEILSQLEKEKPAMGTFSTSEHWSICRKVADRVFDNADEEDRAGLANKRTAKTFYAAGTFYEILQQFYDKSDAESKDGDQNWEQRDEEEQRRLYCKWKATEILNAIKEGREPTPGGYQKNEPDKEETKTEEHVPGSLIEERDEESSPSNVELPAAPSMPASDFFAPLPSIDLEKEESEKGIDAADAVESPSYSGIEININGDPEPSAITQPFVEDVEEDSADDDIFVPGPPKEAAAKHQNSQKNDIDLPPPSYSEYTASSQSSTRPVSESPQPPPAPSVNTIASQSTSRAGGVLSSLFGKSSGGKISKEKMSDAVELTKFALAALQKGDGELGRERLQQALDSLK